MNAEYAWKLVAVERETVDRCEHCGTAIKWVCRIRNVETGEELAVGRQCCANFSSRLLRDANLEVELGRRRGVARGRIERLLADPRYTRNVVLSYFWNLGGSERDAAEEFLAEDEGATVAGVAAVFGVPEDAVRSAVAELVAEVRGVRPVWVLRKIRKSLHWASRFATKVGLDGAAIPEAWAHS